MGLACATCLIPVAAFANIGSFQNDFTGSSASLTENFRQANDAPVTSASWGSDVGVSGSEGVLINNTGTNNLFYRPSPPDNATSTVDFLARDPGTSHRMSVDFRFFNTTTETTVMSTGVVNSNANFSALITSSIPSMVGYFARVDSQTVAVRFRNNASNTAQIEFPQSLLPNGHWFRLNFVLTRNDVQNQFGYEVELLHLGADGLQAPSTIVVNGNPVRVSGVQTNTSFHSNSAALIGIHARRAPTTNGGVTAFDNLTYSVEPVEIERFDWSAIPEIYPGIRHAQVTLTTPRRLFINALLVDSHHPDIRFTTTGRHPNWGQQMSPPLFVTFNQDYFIRTGRQRTRDFLLEKRTAGFNAVAAINAAPWKPWAELSFWQSSYAYADLLGLTISHGELVDVGNNRPSLIVEKDWTLRMQASPANTDSSNMLHAVSGNQFVLQNGIAFAGGTLEPRTGYGLCRDNRFLILMTADGRQTISEGLTLTEVGQFLRYFGAWTGINMDGGGSTTMVLRDPNTTNINIVNSPSGSARTVGANLAIYYVDPENTELISFADWFAFRRVPPELRDPLDDANADGIPNILAYALNIDPAREGDTPRGTIPQQLAITEENNSRFLNLDFRVNRHAVNLDIEVQLSQTLAPNSWSEPADLQLVLIGTDPLSHDPIYRASTEITELPHAFLRLKVGELDE